MNDFDNDTYNYEMEQDVVSVYRDRERAGGFREVMGTEMEMSKRYGPQYERLQRMMTRMNPEDRVITQLENYFFHVDSIQKLPMNSIKSVIDAFRRTTRYMYKNPYIFVLGWLYSLYGLPTVRKIMKETGQTEISEVDVIRYFRLYESVSVV